jgi:hypothetical protein
MRKSVEITIVGDLHYRQIIVTGGAKSGCVTVNSNLAGIGIMKSNHWILEYEEIHNNIH